MKKFLLFLIYTVLYFSCQESTDESSQDNPKKPLDIEPMITITPVVQHTSNINFTSAAQKILVPTGMPKEITGSKGLKILIDTAALQTENGMPIGRQIEVSIKEITDQEALFKNDAPTVSSGKLLISAGSYYIEMASAGNKLKIKEGRSLKINVPSTSADEMELFYGQKDTAGILNWEPAGEKMNAKKTTAIIHQPAFNNITKAEVAVDTAMAVTAMPEGDLKKLFDLADSKNNRLSVKEFDSVTSTTRDTTMLVEEMSKSVQIMMDTTIKIIRDQQQQIAYYYPVEIRRLGWVNCDRFYKTKEKCDIQFANDTLLNPSTAAVYIVFKTLFGMQKEYINFTNTSLTATLNNNYPVGLPVKLIAITNIDGKFYTCKQEFVLAKKEMITLKFKPVEDIEVVKNSYLD